MKSILLVLMTISILLMLAPEETEGPPPAWFAFVAAKAGWKLIKHAYYARCNVRGVPASLDCPCVAYGAGLSRGSAQKAAKLYASTVGDSGCAAYVGHCQIRRLKK